MLYGIANLLVQKGWVNREFIERSTTGFAEFAAFVRQFTPDKVAAETGLTVGQLFALPKPLPRGKAVSFWWTMGVNQSHEATRTAQAVINLALMTGNIGRPGTGANSITGQCNAMGSRLFANAYEPDRWTRFPQRRTSRGGRAVCWTSRRKRSPRKTRWPTTRFVDGIADGKIKGLWVIATNTVAFVD